MQNMAVKTSDICSNTEDNITLKMFLWHFFFSFQIGSAIKKLKRETFCIALEDLISSSASISISF